MSFRSRTKTIQPATRRRSLSSSRVPSSANSTNYYLNNSASFSSHRPLSSTFTSSYTPSNYISQYSSRDNLYTPPSSTSRSSYYSGSTNGISGRRDSYGGTTYKNPYASDRYVSPYTSYDKGITTASLCLSSYGSKVPSSSYTKPTTYKSDYTPRHTNLSQSRLSGSNTSLSSYTSIPTKSVATSTSATGICRSQSFKDPDRKNRNARRSASMKSSRSLSISSEKSEGYEVRFR